MAKSSKPSPDWFMRHFSVANKPGPNQGNVPALLRRVAKNLERIPGAEVFDLVLHNEIRDGEDWYSVTVYYSLPGDT